jgi:hypothetical protein
VRRRQLADTIQALAEKRDEVFSTCGLVSIAVEPFTSSTDRAFFARIPFMDSSQTTT